MYEKQSRPCFCPRLSLPVGLQSNEAASGVAPRGGQEDAQRDRLAARDFRASCVAVVDVSIRSTPNTAGLGCRVEPKVVSELAEIAEWEACESKDPGLFLCRLLCRRWRP